jgi:predicted AAA+ superfamily ATPase
MTYSHAEVLNLSNISRECGVKRSTCDGYLEILEDLLLGYRVPVFKKKNRKQTVDSDKFYYFDSGVYQTLKPRGPLDDQGATAGPALEGFVEQHLRAWVAHRNDGDNIYYWRTKSGNEVDFVIYGPNIFLAIEVKNCSKVQKADLSGLKSFLDDYPMAQAIFCYRGKDPERHGDIECIPVEKFLMTLSS